MTYPPSQKPPIWSIDPGVIAYNCQKASMPVPELAMPMWEGAGALARDYSGRGNHGTLVGGATWGPEGIDFNGTDGYIDIDNDIYMSGSFTITASVNVTAWDEDNAIIIGRVEGDPWFQNYYLSMKIADQQFIGGFYDTVGSSWREVLSDTGKPTGTWMFIIVTWDTLDDRLRIYVNGDLETTSAQFSGAVPRDAGNTEIGALTAVTPDRDHLNGAIKSTNLFDVALTAYQAKFISDNPYFMYQIPEEMYGYVAGAPPVGAIMNQFQKYNIGADLYNGGIIA
jgi:hypothetical protein